MPKLQPAAILCALIFSPLLTAAENKANKLAGESSAYLRQHAHNPVNWFPWGVEAFQKAKAEGKWVFLSIGYSSCHWCHVMEKESFANEEIAKIMNDNFICIKVDREEKPDIDHVYLTALNVMGQRGGWPLSMFLLADGRPLFGGTYWPPFDKKVEGGEVQGFKSVLETALKVKKEKAKEILEQAESLSSATRRSLQGEAVGLNLVDLDRSLVNGAMEALQEEFDPVHGGFSSAARNFQGPKFPTPSVLRLFQKEKKNDPSGKSAKMLDLTLEKMALGGIFDHLGGGFHRYTVERTWTVPHFEKMLYDNAQLCEVYADALKDADVLLYRQTLRSTCDFILARMTSPEGGFYSSLDADSEGVEGKYYVWDDKEITELLPDKQIAGLFRVVYGSEPNFEGKHLIPRRSLNPEKLAAQLKRPSQEIESDLQKIRATLLKTRSLRAPPFLDTKILTGWNGQMIAGLARASAALKEPSYLAAAEKNARFLLNKMVNSEGRLLRVYGAAPGEKPQGKFLAYLEDYAFLVHGLLVLHEITGDEKWRAEGVKLTDLMIKHHGKEGAGPFYQTSNEHEKLFARAIEMYDGAQPSGNSVAIANLTRLGKGLEGKKYIQIAEGTLKRLSGRLKVQPGGSTGLAESLAHFLEAKGK